MAVIINRLIPAYYKYFNFLFAIVIAGMYVNTLIFPNMGVDASYFLRVTECIEDGAIPEYDLRILYPPLIFYMLLPIKLIIGNAIAYEIFLGYMFFIQLINVFLIYKISGHYSSDKFIRVFAGLCYLFLSVKLEGEYLFLEPFINLWGLMAICVYLKKGNRPWVYLMISGVLVFLAYMIKQYGLAYAAFIYMLILIDNHSSFRKVIRNGLLFSSGVGLALLAYMMLFRVGYGVWYDFFAGGRLSVYGEKDFSKMLIALAEYLYIGPYLILLLVPGVFIKLIKTKKHILAYLFLIFILSYQFYYNSYDHYFLLVLPALLIIGIMLYDGYYRKYPAAVCIIMILSLFISEFLIGKPTKNLLLSRGETLTEEIRRASEISNEIPKNTRVYIIADVKLYYLSHLNPAIPEKFGFLYNNVLMFDDFKESLYKAEFLIVPRNRLNQHHQLIDSNVKITDVIEDLGLILKHETRNYLLFKNSHN